MGAEVRVRTRLTAATRTRDGELWRVTLADAAGSVAEVTARALVNAERTVGQARARSRQPLARARERPPREGQPHRGAARARRRPRVHPAERRQPDRVRDPVRGPLHADRHHRRSGRKRSRRREITDDEVDYLLALANTYLARPLSRRRHRVDLCRRAAALRRRRVRSVVDHPRLRVPDRRRIDAARCRRAGAVDLRRQAHDVSQARRARARRAEAVLPADGAGVDPRRRCCPAATCRRAGVAAWTAELVRRYPAMPAALLRGLAHRHGSRATVILGDAKTPADLGEDFGNGLTAAEIDHCVRDEWARTADDVLWRRTKCGLAMPAAARARVAAYVANAWRPPTRARRLTADAGVGADAPACPRCPMPCGARCAACSPTSTTR